MSGKTKSFFEDTLILIIIAAIIYGIYTYFFATKEITNTSNQNQNVVEKPVSIKTENIDLPDISVVKSTEEINDEVKIAQVKKEEIKEEIEEKIKTEEIPKEIKEVKTEQNIEENSTVPVTIEDFYKSIEKNIYSNISKNLDKNTIDKLDNVNIRITILKNGEYEQLKYMSGNRQYYNLIKSSILETFPVKINDNLKYKFPRYFRMKVKF